MRELSSEMEARGLPRSRGEHVQRVRQVHAPAPQKTIARACAYMSDESGRASDQVGHCEERGGEVCRFATRPSGRKPCHTWQVHAEAAQGAVELCHAETQTHVAT